VSERTKHTPEPWTVRRIDYSKGEDVSFEIIAPSGFVAQTIMRDRASERERIEQDEANAALISAAPELLATWRDYIDQWNVRHEIENCPEDDTCECPLVARINAAIRKAEATR